MWTMTSLGFAGLRFAVYQRNAHKPSRTNMFSERD
jgi:hypothetical protein